jgi:hypothetical protein
VVTPRVSLLHFSTGAASVMRIGVGFPPISRRMGVLRAKYTQISSIASMMHGLYCHRIRGHGVRFEQGAAWASSCVAIRVSVTIVGIIAGYKIRSIAD